MCFRGDYGRLSAVVATGYIYVVLVAICCRDCSTALVYTCPPGNRADQPIHFIKWPHIMYHPRCPDNIFASPTMQSYTRISTGMNLIRTSTFPIILKLSAKPLHTYIRVVQSRKDQNIRIFNEIPTGGVPGTYVIYGVWGNTWFVSTSTYDTHESYVTCFPSTVWWKEDYDFPTNYAAVAFPTNFSRPHDTEGMK